MLTGLIIYSIISTIGIILLIWGLKNLLRKHEELENFSIQQDKLFKSLKSLVDTSDKKIKDLDHRGTFESDDEVGTFFKNLKEVQTSLNHYFGA